ncbi:MAG: efflux RND transporter permease subunit [Planctomycetota bacterium]
MRSDRNIEWSTLFLRNRHLLWVTITAAFVAGLSAFGTMPRLEDPRIVNRNPIILTPFPGASAERVEALVTDPLEESLQEIEAITQIRSTSRAGMSVLSIELNDEVDWEENVPIFSEIRDRIADVQPLLPPEAGAPELDDKRDPVAFTLLIAIHGEEDDDGSLGLKSRLAEQLADELRTVAGTELVRVYGDATEEFRVTTTRADLADVGLTAADVAAAIQRADAKGAAGTVRAVSTELAIEVRGELSSADRISEIPILEDEDGRVVRVGDIASVRRDIRTPSDTIGRVDGERAVFIGARMNRTARTDVWGAAAMERLNAFRTLHGGGLTVDVVFEQEVYTTGRLQELGGNLLAGAMVIIFVIWLTLGFRQALIVGTALPIVVCLTLFAIQASGNSLHQMSIFGMIIALGLLIDNAIVVTDEVSHRRRQGASPIDAVAGAVRMLVGPLGASTLTTVLAFAPIMLLPGGGGDFVGSIGQSVMFAVVFSYMISLTVIAALAGLFVRPRAAREQRWWRDGVTSQRAAVLLESMFRRLFSMPAAAIALAMFLPLSGFILSRTLGDEFFPPVDRNLFHVQIWTSNESSLATTADAVSDAEALIREHDDVTRVHWLVGGSFPTVWYNLIMDKDGATGYAQGIVETTSADATKQLVSVLQTQLRESMPDAQVLVRSFGQGPPVVSDIEYQIFGPDTDVLQTLGEEMRLALHRHPDVLETQMSFERADPKLWIDADEDEARLAGLSLTDISEQVNAAYEGAVGGTVLEQLEEIPVRVQLADDQRGDITAIASTPLSTPMGDWVPLTALADVTLRPERGTITRLDGERSNFISAYTRPGALPIDVGNDVLASLEAEGFTLPAGYRLGIGGAAEQDSDAVGNLKKYMPIIITVAIATLVLTFRSVLLAVVLGLVAFQSVGLGFLATWSIGFPVSFNTILGVLGLIGVALNDSIVVISTIRAHPTASRGDVAGLAEAVMTCLRHVVSTTLTTVGGFLPLLIFTGGDFWPSLAIVMAGGITGATILAILFVPAMYRLIMLLPGSRRALSVPTTASVEMA